MDTKLTLRVDLGNGRALGPGKIRLLEAARIDSCGTTGSASRYVHCRGAAAVAVSLLQLICETASTATS
jgi:hypothetical protein